ncbi:unnamed protein product, partial [Ceratitis capitata]
MRMRVSAGIHLTLEYRWTMDIVTQQLAKDMLSMKKYRLVTVNISGYYASTYCFPLLNFYLPQHLALKKVYAGGSAERSYIIQKLVILR